MSPVEQKLLQDAATEAQNWQRTVSREVSSKALGELTAKGMVYLKGTIQGLGPLSYLMGSRAVVGLGQAGS